MYFLNMNLFRIAMKIASEEMNVEKALQLIPKEFHSSFKKAYDWKPKSKGWAWSINKALKATKDGKNLSHTVFGRMYLIQRQSNITLNQMKKQLTSHKILMW